MGRRITVGLDAAEVKALRELQARHIKRGEEFSAASILRQALRAYAKEKNVRITDGKKNVPVA